MVGATAARIPASWPSDRYDRRKLIVGFSIVATTVSVSVTAEVVVFLIAIAVWLFLYGAASFCIYPIAITYALDRAKPEEFVEVVAAIPVAYGFESFAEPFLALLV